MREVDKEWFDDLGLMRAYKGQDSVNGLTFTASAIMLGVMNPTTHKVNKWLLAHMKNHDYEKSGNYLKLKQTWRDGVENRDASHDEATSFVYLCKKFGFFYHQDLDLSPYWHPRDFAWYRMQKSKWWAWLAPIYSLVAITTCARKQMNVKAQQYDTDGKILYLLRRDVAPMPLTDWICDKLLTWRWGRLYVKALFDVYYHHSITHPLREVLK